MWLFPHTVTASVKTRCFLPIAHFGRDRLLGRKWDATGNDCVGRWEKGKPQLCNLKTNRKSLSQAWLLLKTLFESLNQLFQNKCSVWLQWNFCYWDVVERGPRSELSSYWARQTAAWLRGGARGAHPFLPHTPHHPTPQCHFTSDLIHSPHPSFMFTLTSFPLCYRSLGRRCSIMADIKHLNVCFCYFLLALLNFSILSCNLLLNPTKNITCTTPVPHKYLYLLQSITSKLTFCDFYNFRFDVNLHTLAYQV